MVAAHTIKNNGSNAPMMREPPYAAPLMLAAVLLPLFCSSSSTLIFRLRALLVMAGMTNDGPDVILVDTTSWLGVTKAVAENAIKANTRNLVTKERDIMVGRF